jgi:hypothetical protein
MSSIIAWAGALVVGFSAVIPASILIVTLRAFPGRDNRLGDVVLDVVLATVACISTCATLAFALVLLTGGV